MTDFEAQIAAALDARDLDALLALEAAAASKVELKAVKRALHLLSERGVVVDRRPQKVTGAVEPMPLVMMGPPEPDAGRLFTLALPDAAGLQLVEAFFHMPEGLERLGTARSQRTDYVPWVKQMCAPRPGQLPQRVWADDALLQRKLWEIRECLRAGRLGSDVATADANRLPAPSIQPPHPAESCLTGGLNVLSAEALGEQPWRVAAFFHAGPLAAIRQQLEDRGAALFEARDPLDVVVPEWAAEWGHERIRETLLDLTSYALALGDRDAALTFQLAARGDLVAFLKPIVSVFLEG